MTPHVWDQGGKTSGKKPSAYSRLYLKSAYASLVSVESFCDSTKSSARGPIDTNRT